MSENPISISNLNDFIFCPVSIYFHSLDSETESLIYQDNYQINGTDAHRCIDEGIYSDRKSVLQGTMIYCEKYNLCGKIDTFDVSTGMLTERKKKVKQIFDGYIFQLYAQYFSLIEMGYKVNQIRIYSMDDNKIYNVLLPEQDNEMLTKFEQLLESINNFSFENFEQINILKCQHCIYEELCSYSAEKRRS